MYGKVMDDVKRLATMPSLGRVEPWLERESIEFRSLISCKRYRVVYYIENDNVFIADVGTVAKTPKR